MDRCDFYSKTLRAIFYQISVGAVGFAIGAEISSLPLRPATISAVGLTQTVLYATPSSPLLPPPKTTYPSATNKDKEDGSSAS